MPFIFGGEFVADGRVVIDTEINTDGIEIGEADIVKAMKRLTVSINHLSDKIQGLFTGIGIAAEKSYGQIQNTSKGINEISNSAQSAEENIEDLQKQMESITITGLDFEQKEFDLEEEPRTITVKNVGYDKAAIEYIEKYSQESTKAAQDVNQLQKEISELQNKLKELEKSHVYFGDDEYDEAFIKLQDLKQSLKEYKENLVSPIDTTTMEGEIEALVSKLSELRREGQGLGDTEYDETVRQLAIAKERVKEYAAELSKTPKMVERENQLLAEKQAKAEAAAKREEEQQAKAQARAEAVAQKEAQRQAKAEADEAKRVAAEEKILEAKRAVEVQEAMEEQRLKEIAETARVSSDEIINMRQELEKLSSRQADLKKAGLGEGYEEYDQNIIRIENIRKEIDEYRKTLTDVEEKANRNIFSGIIEQLKKLSNIAQKASTALAKITGQRILNGLKKITAGIFGLNKTTNKSTSGFNTSLKTLLRYGIGIESLFTLINKLRSALVEGFKNLAQYSNDTNATISGLMASLEQCKNALATAFDPILQAVAPALNYLINLVTAAATAVAHLIAALTGKSTFIKATKVQKDYAKSLKGTGSAAKSAGEDAEGALAPFDKLNVMADEATGKGSGGGGGGAGGTLAEDMFETVPVESKFKQLADNLKKFIKSEDWKGLGAYIANGLNAGLQKIYDVISWDNVGPKITYFVNAFTETFNSIVDNLDWDLLGGTIGAGVNTVVNTLNLLIEGIDWENIGIKLSVGFRGMLNEINWTNLGNLIGNKFMITWNIFKGFVDDMWRTNNFTGLSGWNELGISLAQGFNGVFEKMDFGQIGTTLGKVITGIFQAAIDFAKTFDWKGLGENIANGINQFLENFDATTVAKGTNEVIKGLLDSLIAAIEKTDWHLMGEKLAEFLENLDWNGIADRVFEAIGAGFGGFFSFLQGLIGDAWNDVIDWWHENAYEDGEFTIQGLFDGIINKLKDIGSWIKEHIFDPFIKGFKTAFGIHSPSTVMQEMGGYLMDGLKNGISNFIPNVIQKFADLKNKIISKWDEVKQNTATKWEEIKSNLSQKWDNLKTTAGTTFNSIKQKVSEMWGNVQTDTSSKWGDIKNTLFGVWESLKDKAEKIFGKIKDAVKNTWEKIQGFDGDVGTAGRSALAAASATVRTMTPSAQPVNLPRLASGTVVPPRAGEFAAILGDNNRESEVVSPLSTIKQALVEALGEFNGMGGDINLNINLDGKVIYQDVIKRNRMEKNRTGKNLLLT